MSWHSDVRCWLGKKLRASNYTSLSWRSKIIDLWMDGFEVWYSRVQIGLSCLWLALTGDKEFFWRYEANHPDGGSRWLEWHRREKHYSQLRAALEQHPEPSLIEELGCLRQQVKNLRRELTKSRENNETRNKELDALHYVWCDGGCSGGVHRHQNSPPDEETVRLAVRNTKRLVRWFNSREFKELDTLDESGVRNRFRYIAIGKVANEAKAALEAGDERAAVEAVRRVLKEYEQ